MGPGSPRRPKDEAQHGPKMRPRGAQEEPKKSPRRPKVMPRGGQGNQKWSPKRAKQRNNEQRANHRKYLGKPSQRRGFGRCLSSKLGSCWTQVALVCAQVCALALKLVSWIGLWGQKRALGPASARQIGVTQNTHGVCPRVSRGLAGGRGWGWPPGWRCKLKLKLKA